MEVPASGTHPPDLLSFRPRQVCPAPSKTKIKKTMITKEQLEAIIKAVDEGGDGATKSAKRK